MIESAVCNNPKIILICFFNKWEWWWINRLVESPWLGGAAITTFAIKKLYTPGSYVILVTSEGFVRILSYLKSCVLTCTLRIWTSRSSLCKILRKVPKMRFISPIYMSRHNFWCMTWGFWTIFFQPQKVDREQSGSQSLRKTVEFWK